MTVISCLSLCTPVEPHAGLGGMTPIEYLLTLMERAFVATCNPHIYWLL